MKKIISVLIIVFLLTGCNKQIIDLKYSFDKAICNYDGDKLILEIDKWKDYDGEQLQIISDGKTYLISSNKCYLVKD